MATSGYTETTVSQWHTLRFEWTRVSTSVENCTSTIDWNLKLISGKYGSILHNIKEDNSVYIFNGSEIKGESYLTIRNNETLTLASGTSVIKHDDNGKRSFSYSFKQDFNLYFQGEYISYVTGNGIGILDDIPVHATLYSANNFSDEVDPVIFYNNPSGDSVDTLQTALSFNGTTASTAYRSVPKDSSMYIMDLSSDDLSTLYESMPNNQTRSVYILLRSVIGNSTKITSLQRTFTIANAVPSIDPELIDINEGSLELTEDDTVLINGYNTVKIAFNAVANKGSSIVSKEVSCGSSVYIPYNPKTDKWDGYLNNVESDTFTFKVTDSRGLSTSKVVTAEEFIPYHKPSINFNPTFDITGNTAKINLNVYGLYFDGIFSDSGQNGNILGMAYRYKRGNDSYTNWNSLIDYIQKDDENYSVETYITTPFDLADTVIVDLKVYDSVVDSDSGIIISRTVSFIPTFDWSKSDFAFNVPVKCPSISIGDSQMTDFVVSEGTLNGWAYRKWNSGFAECWYTYSNSVSLTNNYDGFRYSDAIHLSYPFDFTGIPKLFVEGGSTTNVDFARKFGTNTASQAGFHIVGMTEHTAACTVHLYAFGNWK